MYCNIFRFHLLLDNPRGLSEILKVILHPPIICLAILNLLYLIPLLWINGQNNETPHYKAFLTPHYIPFRPKYSPQETFAFSQRSSFSGKKPDP